MATLWMEIPRLCPNENRWWWAILPLQMLEEMPWQEAVWPTMCRQARGVARGPSGQMPHSQLGLRQGSRPQKPREALVGSSFAISEALLTSREMSLIMVEPWSMNYSICDTNLFVPKQKCLRKSIHPIIWSCELRFACCARCKCCAGKSAMQSWIWFKLIFARWGPGSEKPSNLFESFEYLATMLNAFHSGSAAANFSQIRTPCSIFGRRSSWNGPRRCPRSFATGDNIDNVLCQI